MREKEVVLVLTNRWADWEAAYAVAVINDTPGFKVKTAAADLLPKASIGGLRAAIDSCVADYHNFNNVALIILPGGYSWLAENQDEIADFVRRAVGAGVPVAAICGATLFLAKHGFLNTIRHTGDEKPYFFDKLTNEKDYTGQAHFAAAQLVNDHGFITANETAAVAFAREIFQILKIDTEEEIAIWYDKFKNGMFS